MSNNIRQRKNDRCDAGTSQRSNGTICTTKSNSKNSTLQQQCQQKQVDEKVRILNAKAEILLSTLKNGAENAIPAFLLTEKLGLPSTRELRSLITELRTSGAVICSSKRGYFLPSVNPLQALNEINFFVHLQDRRLRSNRAAVASARKLRQELVQHFSGQIQIEDGGCD